MSLLTFGLGELIGNRGELIELAADLALKSALACALAGLLALLTRHASASVRHLVWCCAILTLILLPFLALLAPTWEIGIFPDLANAELPAGLGGSSDSPALAPTAVGVLPAAPYGNEGVSRSGWLTVLLVVLGSGHLLAFAWVLHSRIQLRRLVRGTRPLAPTWQREVESIMRQLGVRRRIHLGSSVEVAAGITLGAFRQRIVLSHEARHWPPSRRRLVVAHELAHVSRRDALVEDLVALVIVLYWFQPLVWLAIRQLRFERERACDDLVLHGGARPADYAAQLLQLATDVTAAPQAVRPQLAFVSGSWLKRRLLHILRSDVSRKPAGSYSAVGGGLLVILVAFLLSSTGFWSVDREPLEGPPASVLSPKVLKLWETVDDRRSSAAFLLERLIEAEGIERAVAAFHRITARETLLDYRVEEGELNSLGYRLLYRGHVGAAVTIFELNAGAFPQSWNVHDSLGEAYRAVGELALAHRSYCRSLELGPRNPQKTRQILRLIEAETE